MTARRMLIPGSAAAAAVLLVALLVFGVAGQGQNSSLDAAANAGRPLPAPSAGVPLPRLGASGTQTLAALRGKVVVLNVFASWCEPCKAEAPILAAAERRLAARGATVLGVTYLDNAGDSEAFVRTYGVDYPVVRDVSGAFVRSFGATGVPETFVIDRRGRVIAVRRFQLQNSAWLDATTDRALATAA